MRHRVRLALLIGILQPALPAFAQAPPPKEEKVAPEEAKKRKDWNESMLRKAAPRKGCFKADYPKTDWVEVPCGKGPQHPAIPRSGPRPIVIGNTNDVSAQAPSGHISLAIGSFENVNVTGENGPIANSGPSVTDAYTLQINANNFTTSACNGSPDTNCQPAANNGAGTGCCGWEQFVFENDGSSSANLGKLTIQYWLIRYNATCPPNQGWTPFTFTNSNITYCYKDALDPTNGWYTQVPSQAVNSANLANLKMSASATSTGDSVTLSTGGTTTYNRTGDNSVNLASGWTAAEFNLFGDGGNNSGGGMASFNSGASVNVRTEIVYGGTGAPVCL